MADRSDRLMYRSYRVLFWVLALGGLAADQATKYGVFSWLADVPGNTHVVFADRQHHGFALVAQFETTADGHKVPHVNHGALFGFLRDYQSAANIGFAVISFLAAAAILYWSTQQTTARDLALCAALGLILAGTLGNLYDRLVFNGVRDFLHWNYLFDWPVFNVADCCLVTGAGLLLIQAFSAKPAAPPARPHMTAVAQQHEPARAGQEAVVAAERFQ
jgi:lipoprotein signal peptidase